MKRSALVAFLIVGGLVYAQPLTFRPTGTVTLIIPPRPTVLQPVPTNTINRVNNSVFSTSLLGSGGLPSTGQVAYPQSFPATSNRVEVPATLSREESGAPESADPGDDAETGRFDAPVVGSDPSRPSVSDYSCATHRPDFQYEPGKLSFAPRTTTDLGQIDMNFWSGLPPGPARYVPLGEF